MALGFKPFGSNIHAHSDYSLDGGSSVKKIVKRAKELGLGHIVLTEHGNFNSAAQLAMHAKDAGLSFSHGIEVYLDPPKINMEDSIVLSTEGRSVEEQVQDVIVGKDGQDVVNDKRSYMHLTVLFKTVKAYEYFCKLTPIMESRAVIRFGERKPIITWDELAEIGSDLVIGTGCLVGFVQKWVMQGQPDVAERAFQMLRSLVQPGCLFLELFPHCVTHEWQKPKRDDAGRIIEPGKFVPNECTPEGTPRDIQKEPNAFILHMGQKYKERIVVSEDSHFAYPSQKAVQDARLGNGQENWRFFTSYHMRTPAECFEELQKFGITSKQMEEFVDNSYALKDALSGYKFETSKDRWILPTHDGNTVHKLAELIKKHGRMPKNDPRYAERLKREVQVLHRNSKGIDFLPYIFEVEDVSSWCKDNGVLMNLRGSAGGSLIAYLVGASITDPIKYDLPFERFITDGRINSGAIPDMDSDFSNKGIVIENRKKKYGDRIVSLSTNINLKLKNSIRDAERTLLGRVRPETEAMCARFPGIPQGPTEAEWLFGYEDKDTGEHVEGFWDQSEEIRTYASQSKDVWSMVTECLGVMRNKGSHACGFLITPEPAQNYFPLTWVGSKADGQLCTGFEPKGLEYSGGIKYDFLGVQTLEVIRIATELIKDRHGVSLPWQEYDHSDDVFKEVFHTGDTAGVFQFSTNVVKPLLKQIKPRSVRDLSAITALGRPGTLQAPAPDGSDRTCAEYYIAVAQGEKPYYIHADMEPILKETNGVILYQEQLLYTFTHLGGYTLEAAEMVRRSVSKKDKTELQKHLNALKSKLLERGWKQAQADLLCDQLVASNRYSFNKSHSMSYGIVGYNTAWLKYYYPLEFWTAELTVFGDKEEKLKSYVAALGKLILQPSISKSNATSWKIEGDKVRAPLSVIKGLGPSATEAIVSQAPYKSVEDFAARCSGRAVNRGVFAKLVLAGLFDEFGLSVDDMLTAYWKAKKIKDSIPADYVGLDDIQKFVHRAALNMLAQEKLCDIVGPKLIPKGWVPTGRAEIPFALRQAGVIMLGDATIATKYLSNPYVTQMKKDVYMVALFLGSSVDTTKTGKKLLKVKLSDGSVEFEAVDWNRLSALKFPKNTLVVVSGKLKKGYKVPISISMGSIEQL